jgi:hypothetical protein
MSLLDTNAKSAAFLVHVVLVVSFNRDSTLCCLHVQLEKRFSSFIYITSIFAISCVVLLLFPGFFVYFCRPLRCKLSKHPCFSFGLGHLQLIPLIPSPVMNSSAYYAPIFEGMATALGLKYERMIAHPDSDEFFKCVKERNGWTTDGTGKNRSALVELEVIWDRARVAQRKGDYSVLGTHHESSSQGLSHIDGLRQCGRSQQLRVDAASVAARLVALASDMCAAWQKEQQV